MGASNVVLVVTRWSRYLNDKPFRALVHMAVVSMDNGNPPRYWGGWPGIAQAVCASFPDGCAQGRHPRAEIASGRCPDCAGAQRAAARSVKALAEAGAIRLRQRPRKGVNAEYELLIGQLPEGEAIHRYGLKVPPRGADCATPSDAQTRDAERRADTRRRASPMRDAERRAEEESRGVLPGTDAETRSPEAGTSPASVPVEKAKCGSCKWLINEFGHAPGCAADVAS